MTTQKPLATSIVEIATKFIGVREHTRNRGPEISMFWDFTNYREGDENREPWCCAAVIAWIQMADEANPGALLSRPPKMAACATFMEWARDKRNGCTVFSADNATLRPQAGDVVCYLPNLSHIGIVEKDYDGSGKVHTIEGNTDDGGSREGDGVYRRARNIGFCGRFIRLPEHN